MGMHDNCCCCHNVSRRHFLRGGVAGAAGAVTAIGGISTASARRSASAELKKTGMRAIDIHAHYFPAPFLELINTDGRRFNGESRITDQAFFYKTPAGSNGPLPLKFIDLKIRLADMDEQGVAVQALSLTTPMIYWADGELSHKLAKTWNDAAVEAHRAHPDRFVVLATLPMLDPDRAIDELNRVSKLPGVRGIYMGTNINHRDLDDPLFEPIFARIEALDLPVFLHPLQTIGGDRMKAFYLVNLIGNPADTGVAACHLIFGGVLDRHPKLQVNLPHAGGIFPILIGRIDRGWKVRAETKRLANAPSTYLRRFTYDTIAHSKPVMEFVISEVGADRVMLGSDYCFDMGYEEPVKFFEELRLRPEQRRMILGGTAARLLKI